MPSPAYYSPAPASPAYSPLFNGTPQIQPANWQQSVGDFFGNLGQSWQGGSDQAMYASPAAGAAGGAPYATVPGVINSAPGRAGIAVGNAATAAIGSVEGFIGGLARGGGVVLGMVIIASALAFESRSRRRA